MARARLTQEEIDAVVKSSKRGKTGNAKSTERIVRSWDLHAAGQLTSDKARAITAHHENYARNLSRAMGIYLRGIFDVTLMSVDQLPYREITDRIPSLTYIQSFQVLPTNVNAAIQLDHSVVFGIVEALLGGSGHWSIEREVTEIEEHIMEGIAKLFLRELHETWQPLGLTVSANQRQPSTQVSQLLPPTEKVLLLSFEIKMAVAKGTMNLFLPSSVLAVMLRDPSRGWDQQRRRGDASLWEKSQDRLLGCKFQIEVAIPSITARVRDLVALREGDVLKLRVPVSRPASFLIAGRELFRAAPVRVGKQRAAHLGEACPEPEEKESMLK